jgi:2-phosphosulfolactate phosphatase
LSVGSGRKNNAESRQLQVFAQIFLTMSHEQGEAMSYKGKDCCRLEWGRRGAEAAAERGDVLVVVDVLSFSTAVATAVENGAAIYPCGKEEDAGSLARRWGSEMAVRREDVPAKGRYSLSPETFQSVSGGERIVLQSPNGATCSRYGSRVPLLLIGALVNAASVAAAVSLAVSTTKASVTVLACGERWSSPHDEGHLRFALEDYLGAGAVLAHLPTHLTRSAEASLCEAAFSAAADRLPELLRDCDSGRELTDRGYLGDVEHAARLNTYTSVPVMRDGLYLSR